MSKWQKLGIGLAGLYLLWLYLVYSITDAMCGPEGCTDGVFWDSVRASLFL